MYILFISEGSHNNFVTILSQTEDDRPTFRPFTRESLAKIEARIQEYNAKTKDLERKRAEGEVGKQKQL